MKSAPRRAEVAVAGILSEKLKLIGASPVKRVPVIGRTGPDISINEIGLVIDVKNRGEIPGGIFHNELVSFGPFLAVPLDQIELLLAAEPIPIHFASKIVSDYWEHMHEWTAANYPNGITCLILHKSGASAVMKGKAKMPFGKSMFVIHFESRRRLQERWLIH